MNCPSVLKGTDKQCDWPTSDHGNWAHANKELQMLWSDNGVKYSAQWVSEWDSLPDEMKAIVDKTKIMQRFGTPSGRG